MDSAASEASLNNSVAAPSTTPGVSSLLQDTLPRRHHQNESSLTAHADAATLNEGTGLTGSPAGLTGGATASEDGNEPLGIADDGRKPPPHSRTLSAGFDESAADGGGGGRTRGGGGTREENDDDDDEEEEDDDDDDEGDRN
jgi:hypothetical protein